jgi:hypothetical protein
MPTEAQINEAVKKLHSQLALSEIEVRDLSQRAVDSDYWTNLVPEMRVQARHLWDQLEDEAFSPEQAAGALAHLRRHGYFRMPTLTALDVAARMRRCVEMVRHAGWPAVFTYVYDEFWTVWRTPSMVRLLSGCLGRGYLQTSGVWTYRVDPQQRGSGWPPHVDSRNDAERLSVWIPLTEATVDNGCMYVIPQDRVPPRLPASFLDWTSVSVEELGTLLHSVRPLPAEVGSVLGWNNCLIHWGGAATELATNPRISIAAEFLREGTKPHRSHLPVLDSEPPSFAIRLQIIGQAILAYKKFEPLMKRYEGLAVRLIAWAKSHDTERI